MFECMKKPLFNLFDIRHTVKHFIAIKRFNWNPRNNEKLKMGRGVSFEHVENHMNPEEGARKQIEIYRRMSGKERLRIAFEMWENALAMTKASERSMNPHLGGEEIEKRARKRMTGGATESH